jgi:hypothetical protein
MGHVELTAEAAGKPNAESANWRPRESLDF